MFAFLLFASVFTESVVDIINNDPTSTWTAIEYPPHIMNPAKFRALLGAKLNPAPAQSEFAPLRDVPTEFDARKQWPNKINPVRNQGQCGSCWAFAISEAFGDMQNIAGCPHGVLSAEDLVACDTTDQGCGGGEMETGQAWLVSHGIATDDCLPYTSGGGSTGKCPSTCHNGSAIVRYKASSWKAVSAAEMQETIQKTGPLAVAFQVYFDFQFYHSGVYHHKWGWHEGGHAVLAIGWGVESGTPYWLIQNSWGTGWGESGYFKILRGKNECEIESHTTVAYPIC